MEPSKPLADAIYWDKVRRARSLSSSEKFMQVGELFANACLWMEAGIRDRFPEAGDAEVDSF